MRKKSLFLGDKSIKCPGILVSIWGKINFLEIFGVKTHWLIGQKSQNSAQYAGAFSGKNYFFGRKVKVPCIIGTIWGKMNFLGIFDVKTKLIIGQKSQNGARYAGAFGRKSLFSGEKSIKCPVL